MEQKIKRVTEDQLFTWINSHKVILMYGTRRVGKTFLLKNLMDSFKGNYLHMNGEDFDVQEMLRKRSVSHYKQILGDTELLIIDEAQAIPDVGKVLKLMIDEIPGLTILATGSSSLDLANKSGEPLTGRQIPVFLFPISQKELKQKPADARKDLEERLIFGSYPEIFKYKTRDEKAAYLQQLVQSYLLKDILSFSGIRHSDKIYGLLRLIAFQAGSEVSYQELSNKLGLSKITVESYLDLLSKVYIIYKLPAYSTNQRNEVNKSAKWFFYDNGVRNAIVNDFRLPDMRNDMGALWESYIISERIKKKSYERSQAQFYFWRNYQQQEIDLLEHENGILRAFEIKFSEPRKFKVPAAFSKIYPDTTVELIHRDNYLPFIL